MDIVVHQDQLDRLDHQYKEHTYQFLDLLDPQDLQGYLVTLCRERAIFTENVNIMDPGKVR